LKETNKQTNKQTNKPTSKQSELFDEEEDFKVKCSHYFMAWSLKDKQQKSKPENNQSGLYSNIGWKENDEIMNFETSISFVDKNLKWFVIK
jgi:hypothetical protein